MTAEAGTAGRLIREELRARRKTQRWLAEQCRVSERHMSWVVTGQSSMTIDLAMAIEDTIGVKALALLIGDIEDRLARAQASGIKPYAKPGPSRQGVRTSARRYKKAPPQA